MPPMLIAAVATITAALVLYTIGVFGERRDGRLEPRHLGFFWAGFVFDTTGTSIMSRIAAADGAPVAPLHAITGVLALVLMALHALWASVILLRRNEAWREGFHSLSVVVWLAWLLPYSIGMLLGIPGLALSNTAIALIALAIVAVVAAFVLASSRREKGSALLGINRDDLLVLAGAVWIIAGANVAVLGIRSALALPALKLAIAALLGLGGALVFVAFHAMFSTIVQRNSRRIRSLAGARQNPLRFLDAKGYVVMAIMMGGGIGLRAAGLIPAWFVAFFYTGLGTALALAGIGFLMHRLRGETWTFHTRFVTAA